MSDLADPPLTIPAGTQVVARIAVHDEAGGELAPAGAVGIVVAAPERVEGPYIVRLPDGREVALRRKQLSIRKVHQREGALPAAPEPDSLRQYIIYRCVVGSRAYGLADAGSDTDRRCIYLPPARLHWSLAGLPEQLEDHAAQEVYWELERLRALAVPPHGAGPAHPRRGAPQARHAPDPSAAQRHPSDAHRRGGGYRGWDSSDRGEQHA